eukprot:g7678.t1
MRQRRDVFADNTDLRQQLKRSEREALSATGRLTIAMPDPAVLLRELKDDSTVFSELEQHWYIDPGELDISSRQLGAGGSGQVFAARWGKEGVAVKQLPVYEGDLQGMVEEARGEVQLLVKCCQHPNVVQLYGLSARAMEGGSAILLVMEQCATSLAAVIKINARAVRANAAERGAVGRREQQWLLSQQSSTALLTQVCIAMRFLHKNGIVHRDLKPGNILLSEHGVVKIADFGCSREGLLGKNVGAGRTTMTANVGTPVYMAPELASSERQAHYSGAVDVYAFALVAWSVFTTERAFDCEFEEAGSVFALMERVRDGLRPRLDSPRIPAFYRELLPQCWRQDPEQRPSFAQVLSRIYESEAAAQEARKDKKRAALRRGSSKLFKRTIMSQQNRMSGLSAAALP